VVFPPVQATLRRFLDQYCYREPADYHQATRTMSHELAGLVRLAPLYAFLTAFLRRTLKAEMVAVYVCRESTVLEHGASQSASGEHCLPPTLSAPEVVALLRRVQAPLACEELEHWSAASASAPLAAVFTALHSTVLIPLFVEDRIAALIAVGGKMSGDPFFKHDMEFLDTVGHQASVALRRAQLYEEIAWMQEYNESILRQMGSGVIAMNQQRHITMMNATAAQLLQMAPGAGMARPIEETLPPALCTPLQQALAGTATYTNEEAVLPLPGRRPLPVALSTSVLHGPDGEHSGAVLVLHDLSRLKELEEEKRRIERLAAIGTFVAGIAHEIKNPLVAIKTLAELLPEQYDDEEFRTTFTQVALHEVDRIDSLVQRLRGLGSPSSVPMRAIRVMPPLDETLALISGELTRRHITLVYQKPPALPAIMGDHDQLKQVFLNLCLNSLEAMGQDGTLRITAGVERAHHATPAQLWLQIADTGPGIPAEDFATIFEPFVTSKATGSGLGLAICRGIVEQHRGTIAAANRPDGLGAIFTLRFPIVQGEDCYEVDTAHVGDAQPARTVA
jgi:signal transduction histidine kinase